MTHSEASDPSIDRLYGRSATDTNGPLAAIRYAAAQFAFGTDTIHAAAEYTSTAALRLTAAVYEGLPDTFAEFVQ